MLAAIGMSQASVTGGALYYLVSSTLGIAAFFLLSELVERGREAGADVLAVTLEAFSKGEDVSDKKKQRPVWPSRRLWRSSARASSGVRCCCCKLPPLPGFIGKFAMLTAAFNPASAGRSRCPPWPGSCWSCC